MARKRDIRVDIENPQTREKLSYIVSQYPEKSLQDILDLAIDGLFRSEADKIQANLQRLLQNNPIKAELGE